MRAQQIGCLPLAKLSRLTASALGFTLHHRLHLASVVGRDVRLVKLGKRKLPGPVGLSEPRETGEEWLEKLTKRKLSRRAAPVLSCPGLSCKRTEGSSVYSLLRSRAFDPEQAGS